MARSSDSNFLLAIVKDKTFQAREIRRVILLAMTYLVVTTVLLGVFYHAMLGRLVDGAAPLFFVSEDMERFNEMVPGLASVLGRWMIVMLIVNVVITVLVGTYITRKLGHPLMAIKRALNEVGGGNLDVRLRESDSREFSELTVALNSAMGTIREQVKTAQDEFEQLEQIQNQPSTSAEDVQTAISKCKNALSYFTVADDGSEKSSAA
ncbi:MAG: methyl-accepting chemotaxis protein [Granulosicoccus sp.]|nr:methyl-accepting chemotaxis protein [Granulosicoccus sp.]